MCRQARAEPPRSAHAHVARERVWTRMYKDCGNPPIREPSRVCFMGVAPIQNIPRTPGERFHGRRRALPPMFEAQIAAVPWAGAWGAQGAKCHLTREENPISIGHHGRSMQATAPSHIKLSSPRSCHKQARGPRELSSTESRTLASRYEVLHVVPSFGFRVGYGRPITAGRES